MGSQTLLFMESQSGSAVSNLSQNTPDPVTGVLGTPDTDGLYEAATADTGNINGDTGYGVLARLTFQGVAAGNGSLSLATGNIGGFDAGSTLRADNPANPGVTSIILNDVNPPPNGDGFFDGPFINQVGTIAVGQDSDGDGILSNACPGQPIDNCPNVRQPLPGGHGRRRHRRRLRQLPVLARERPAVVRSRRQRGLRRVHGGGRGLHGHQR